MPIPKWRLFTLDANIGYRNYRGFRSGLSIDDFVKDKSQLAGSGSNSNYTWNNYLSPNFNRLLNVGANIGFKTRQRNRVVNFGVNYTQHSYRSGGTALDYQSTLIDSFQIVLSNGESTPVFIDSVWIDRELLSHEIGVLSVSAEYVARTSRGRVTGYAGFGGQLGISINREVSSYRYQAWETNYLDTNGNELFQTQQVWPSSQQYSNENFIDGESKVLEGRTAFVLTPYIPIGVEYAPFIHGNWLGRISLEAKGTLGTEFLIIPGARTDIRPFYSLSFGLKYFI